MTPESYLGINEDGKIVSYVGPEATEAYRAIAISHALALYAKTGMKVNRAYTPTRMLKAASSMTGNTYKRGEYKRAAEELQQWADNIKASLPIIGPERI